MNRRTVSLALCFLLAALLAAAQVPAAAQLSDAQAAAMIQALTAQAQGGNAPAMTQAQLQILFQYLVRQSAASSSAMSAAQAQMLMQAMAQSSAAAPGAAVSAAQAQALAKILSAQTQGTAPLYGARSPGLGPTMTPTMTPAPTMTMSSPQPTVAVGPKKPGVVRIGVMQPKAQMGGGANVAEPLRSIIVQYLSGPMVEIAPITAMLGQQIQMEARQKECDYVLSSSISQKAGGGLLRKAMPMASMIPMVGLAGGLAGGTGGAIAASQG